MDTQTKVTGAILAGGLARRMNNKDKGLISFNGQPMVAYALAAMKPLVDQVIISANRNILEYQKFGCPVVSDQSKNFDGPLAGVLAAMIYAKTGTLLVLPCDSPFVRPSLLQKLLSTRVENDADVAVAFDGQRVHPVFLAIKTTLKNSLEDYLQSGYRRMDSWLEQQQMVKADFSAEPTIFTNVNSLPELYALEEKSNLD